MASARFNPNKQWRQDNSGGNLGNIRGIWGCDLEYAPGRVRPAPVLLSTAIGSEHTLFTGLPATMIYTNASSTVADGAGFRYWIVSNQARMYVNRSAGTGTNNMIPDSLANTPTVPTYDAAVFGLSNGVENLFVPTLTDIWRLNAGIWYPSFWTSTTGLAQAALASGNHPLETFLSPYGSFLFVGDGSNLHSIDLNLNSTSVRNQRVQLEDQYSIIWLRVTATKVFIGTESLSRGRATVVEYDPISETTKSYELNGSSSLAGTVKGNVCYTLDNLGIAYKYDGNGFVEIGKLPINYFFGESNYQWGGTVHHEGMEIINDKLHILINSDDTPTEVPEDFPSGVWVLNEQTGNFYCNYRTGNNSSGEKGQSSLNAVGFIKKRSSNSFFAGYGALSGSGSGNSFFVNSPSFNSSPYGRFITPRFYSPDIQSRWNSFWGLIKKMDNTGDSVVVKYRTNERIKPFFDAVTLAIPREVITVTFTSGSIMTTTDANFTNAQVGDEIEVVQGSCGGNTAHITSLTGTSTSTIAIDEVFTLSGDNTAEVAISDWQKIENYSSTTPPQYHEFHIPGSEPATEWIEFKVELRGTPFSPEINDLVLEFTPQLQVK